MRINVDEQAISEPRIKRMAKRLGRPHFEVLGRLMPVWMLCYQRRSAVVSAIDVDIAADLDGFAEAMVADDMAEMDDQGIYVRGVSDRIEFLERQVEKGKRSGEVRRSKSIGSSHNGTTKRTGVQQVFANGSNQLGTSVEQRFKSGRTNSRTYSPDLDLDQAPDLDLRSSAAGGLSGEVAERTGATGSGQGAISEPEPENGGGETGNARSALPIARARLIQPAIPEPPPQAITTAALFMDYVLRNNPQSKLARASETQRENTLLVWSHEIRVMHEVEKLDYGVIQAMIHWCQRDAFWRTVIFSAKSLRDQWDKMDAQRKRPRTPQGEREPSPDEIAKRRARDDAESRASIAKVAEMQRAAEAERPEVVAELARAKAALGIAPREPEQVDDEPEPEEDEPDAE